MSVNTTNDPSFLGLPRELRDLIYTELFRPLVFDSAEPQYSRDDGPYDTRLAILFASRQIHAEASPLVLRHASFHCSHSKDMLRFLISLSPVQIRQLKHLRVGCSLFLSTLRTFNNTSPMTPEWFGFSVATLLKMFPGMQLDLLELHYPSQGTEETECTVSLDVIDSLLKAEGFREAQVFFDRPLATFPGAWDPNDLRPILTSWKSFIETQFRPRIGWSVDLSVEKTADTDNDYWKMHEGAGFTLWKDLESRHATVYRNQPFDGGKPPWTFRSRRGRGPCVVPETGDRVLECVGFSSVNFRKAREVSDHIRWLIKEKNSVLVGRREHYSALDDIFRHLR